MATTTPEVSKVAIKIPPFWPEQPELWFRQIEAQFALNGITADTTKFYYILSQLEPKYALEVQDIFINPPEANKYGTLRSELLKRLSATQGKRIRQLLEQEEIGDRTPSQFLRHMRNLAGTTVSDEFLRTLWSGRLPNVTRAIVSAQSDLPLNKLAEIADHIHAEVQPTQVASTSAPTQSDRLAELLIDRLERLELRVAETSRPCSHKGSRTPRRMRRRWCESGSGVRRIVVWRGSGVEYESGVE
ncbi:uncharacterized protein LOC143363740, partial [Halictus rubicundus]|uniref:uncharacterized protein LOC143363740 n=2 Tax=Halictus rubicundus TaxID=77578 RepID=UPI004036B062